MLPSLHGYQDSETHLPIPTLIHHPLHPPSQSPTPQFSHSHRQSRAQCFGHKSTIQASAEVQCYAKKKGKHIYISEAFAVSFHLAGVCFTQSNHGHDLVPEAVATFWPYIWGPFFVHQLWVDLFCPPDCWPETGLNFQERASLKVMPFLCGNLIPPLWPLCRFLCSAGWATHSR